MVAVFAGEQLGLSVGSFGRFLGLVHFVANDDTGTGTERGTNGTADGCTLTAAGKTADEGTEGTTAATADEAAFGCVGHRATAEQ